jgi:hypothetical protein
MSELTLDDYKYILTFYKKTIPKNKRLMKLNAEKIISEKLCKCIKKIDHKYHSKAIGICTKSIINKKGFKRGKFTCKKKRKINLSKTSKNKN